MIVRVESESMSNSVRELLGAFDRLEEPDRQDFLSEVLRRTRDLKCAPLDDETIDRIADQSFVEYDIREASDAHR
jgi:hypothetical protein